MRRESGAVTVFATDPAIPPLKRCFKAEIARGSGSAMGSSESSFCFGFVNLLIISQYFIRQSEWQWFLIVNPCCL